MNLSREMENVCPDVDVGEGSGDELDIVSRKEVSSKGLIGASLQDRRIQPPENGYHRKPMKLSMVRCFEI